LDIVKKMNKKPNVILITIDALRADHLGFMGYKENISLNIDKLAEESSVFTQAFSVSSLSSYSFPAILASTYPDKKPDVLISEVLKKEGYITAAFHCNPFLSAFFGYGKGWDFFEDIVPAESNIIKRKKTFSFFLNLFREIAFSTFPGIYYWIRYLGAKYLKIKIPGESSLPVKFQVNAAYINRLIKDFIYSIKNKEKPFFIWSHYLDVHEPYFSREFYFPDKNYSFLNDLRIQRFPQHLGLHQYEHKRALRRYMKKYLKQGTDCYDYGIEYMDYQIGELMRFFKKENVYDDSIIIITADHGDEFLEHGGGSHLPKLYNEVLHVPLLIKIPGEGLKVINKKVSLIDLSPTICNLLGIKVDSSFKGENLFEKSDEKPIFHLEKAHNQNRIACQFKNWKYILGNNQEELYNLSEDPKEQENIAIKKPKTLLKMREFVQEFEKKNSS